MGQFLRKWPAPCGPCCIIATHALCSLSFRLDLPSTSVGGHEMGAVERLNGIGSSCVLIALISSILAQELSSIFNHSQKGIDAPPPRVIGIELKLLPPQLTLQSQDSPAAIALK